MIVIPYINLSKRPLIIKCLFLRNIEPIYIFLKTEFFFIQERFNKLIYSINTIIKCGIGQPVKFQLASRF